LVCTELRQADGSRRKTYFTMELCRLEKAQRRDLVGDEQAQVIQVTRKNLSKRLQEVSDNAQLLSKSLNVPGPLRIGLKPSVSINHWILSNSSIQSWICFFHSPLGAAYLC